jgi:hypothetical protein
MATFLAYNIEIGSDLTINVAFMLNSNIANSKELSALQHTGKIPLKFKQWALQRRFSLSGSVFVLLPPTITFINTYDTVFGPARGKRQRP